MKKAVIFAPFWRHSGHVGNNRVDRFVRWLHEDGFHLVMIRAGSNDGLREESWGIEITVRDPIGLYRDARSDATTSVARKPNKLRRTLAYWLFSPDPSVVWARAAAKNAMVIEQAAGASFIFSSSPPESAHVGARQLSKQLNVPQVVDLRDGWLDEPLKPLLRQSALRRWQEGRMEAEILSNAAAILVTSDVWKTLLCHRYSALAQKVTVLTNGYPNMPAYSQGLVSTEPSAALVLIHAGRFLGSRLTQSPNILLVPLLGAVRQYSLIGSVRLIGPLTDYERVLIAQFNAPFLEYGWQIECVGAVPRDELLGLLPQAHGLLLLSASGASIPSKLFEYIPTGRPILVVTERASATWKVCAKLPQAFLIDINGQENDGADQASLFLKEASQPTGVWDCPDDYSEKCLSAVFRNIIRINKMVR
jgi:hypothetical protein